MLYSDITWLLFDVFFMMLHAIMIKLQTSIKKTHKYLGLTKIFNEIVGWWPWPNFKGYKSSHHGLSFLDCWCWGLNPSGYISLSKFTGWCILSRFYVNSFIGKIDLYLKVKCSHIEFLFSRFWDDNPKPFYHSRYLFQKMQAQILQQDLVLYQLHWPIFQGQNVTSTYISRSESAISFSYHGWQSRLSHFTTLYNLINFLSIHNFDLFFKVIGGYFVSIFQRFAE